MAKALTLPTDSRFVIAVLAKVEEEAEAITVELEMGVMERKRGERRRQRDVVDKPNYFIKSVTHLIFTETSFCIIK